MVSTYMHITITVLYGNGVAPELHREKGWRGEGVAFAVLSEGLCGGGGVPEIVVQ